MYVSVAESLGGGLEARVWCALCGGQTSPLSSLRFSLSTRRGLQQRERLSLFFFNVYVLRTRNKNALAICSLNAVVSSADVHCCACGAVDPNMLTIDPSPLFEVPEGLITLLFPLT